MDRLWACNAGLLTADACGTLVWDSLSPIPFRIRSAKAGTGIRVSQNQEFRASYLFYGFAAPLASFPGLTADGIAIRSDCQILARQHIFQFNPIDDRKHTLEQIGNLEPDEIMILLRRV